MWCDDDIIKGCIRYKKPAQKMLYEKYAPVMRGICLRYAHDSQEVSDILQEGFLKVFTNIKQYSGKGSFEGWIKRIVINTAITHYHKNRRHYYHSDIDQIRETAIQSDCNGLPGSESVEIDKTDIDERNIDFGLIENAGFSENELLEALESVPDPFRMVFNLYAVEDYQHKEIAEMLGIDEATSRTRLLRAKKILQRELYKRSIEKLGR